MEIDQNEPPKLSWGVPEELATDLNLEGKIILPSLKTEVSHRG